MHFAYNPKFQGKDIKKKLYMQIFRGFGAGLAEGCDHLCEIIQKRRAVTRSARTESMFSWTLPNEKIMKGDLTFFRKRQQGVTALRYN